MVVKRVDPSLCIGCRVCFLSCPEDVYRFDDEKRIPVVKYPKDCVGCLFCGLLCPTHAIDVDTVKGRKVPEVI